MSLQLHPPRKNEIANIYIIIAVSSV